MFAPRTGKRRRHTLSLRSDGVPGHLVGAQGGLALFLIGILSLPVMCGVWSLALYFMFSEKQPPDKQDDELANLIVAEEVEGCPSDE